MPRSSKLSQGNDASPAHSWLIERVYAPKRERTVELVKQSVDALLEQKERVSLASITAISKKFDPGGQGVSESAILGNERARAYYEQHRSWKGTTRKGSALPSLASHPSHIKPDRDLERVRQRYVRMGKAALVERLLAVEQEYAQQQERWLVQQDELLQWRLRAETAEARLKGGQRA
jgi:hypothetical protein